MIVLLFCLVSFLALLGAIRDVKRSRMASDTSPRVLSERGPRPFWSQIEPKSSPLGRYSAPFGPNRSHLLLNIWAGGVSRSVYNNIYKYIYMYIYITVECVPQIERDQGSPASCLGTKLTDAPRCVPLLTVGVGSRSRLSCDLASRQVSGWATRPG